MYWYETDGKLKSSIEASIQKQQLILENDNEVVFINTNIMKLKKNFIEDIALFL